MHKEVRTQFKEISSPRFLFTHPHVIDPMELSIKEVNLTGGKRYNSATPPLSTQPYLPYSRQIDTPEAPDTATTLLSIDASANACLESGVELTVVGLTATSDALFGIYQYWVQQNLGMSLYGGIDKDCRWQAIWKKLFCPPNATMRLLSGLCKSFSWLLQRISTAYKIRSATPSTWFFSVG